MSRLPVAAFVALAVATVAAFFVTQHLKVSTPLLAGFPAPHPAVINPVDGRVCEGVNHRRMFVSFYLLHRSDDVDVYIVDANGAVVRTLASGVHMRGGNHPQRRGFIWNGLTESGTVAPDGIYYIKVALVHQGRSVLISTNAGGAEPVTVDTIPPRPRVTGVAPGVLPEPGVTKARIAYTGNQGLRGRILIWRTDRPGVPRLVKSYASRSGSTTPWDGRIAGRAAPQGTYLVGLTVTDKACNTGRFPATIPPGRGTTKGAGVTIRYLAAEPPLTPVPAGGRAMVKVDAAGRSYHWTLHRAGGTRRLAAGTAHGLVLPVRLPAGSGALYVLTLRSGPHRTAVPLLSSASAARGQVLVVLPALTWQGVNPVDDDHDGVPNTLTAGYPIELDRPLVDGLPPGFAGIVELLSTLQRRHLSYDLTTDLSLAQGDGPSLRAHRGVILAGNETWVPSRLGAALRSYVTGGGRLLSLGMDSLRRTVALSRVRAFRPSGPRGADILGARVASISRTHGAPIAPGSDELGILGTTPLRYPFYQPYPGLVPPLRVASQAGVSPNSPAIIGYHLGRGLVVDIGLPGFGSSLAHNSGARRLLFRVYALLARP